MQYFFRILLRGISTPEAGLHGGFPPEHGVQIPALPGGSHGACPPSRVGGGEVDGTLVRRSGRGLPGLRAVCGGPSVSRAVRGGERLRRGPIISVGSLARLSGPGSPFCLSWTR